MTERTSAASFIRIAPWIINSLSAVSLEHPTAIKDATHFSMMPRTQSCKASCSNLSILSFSLRSSGVIDRVQGIAWPAAFIDVSYEFLFRLVEPMYLEMTVTTDRSQGTIPKIQF